MLLKKSVEIKIIPEINWKIITFVARDPSGSIPMEKKGCGYFNPWILSILKMICLICAKNEEISELPKIKKTIITEKNKKNIIWIKSLNFFENNKYILYDSSIT